MKTILTTIGIMLLVLLVALMLIPASRAAINTHFFNLQKTDDATSYKIIKKVEDTARAMIVSYESDRLTYEQYKDSESEEKQSWAEQAKMRANKTASSFNNYILENSFVWKDNVPADIYMKLEYIEEDEGE